MWKKYIVTFLTGKQIGTPQLPKAQIFISLIISLIFLFFSISHLLRLFYFSTISYLDCWEKINNLFTDGNRENHHMTEQILKVTINTITWVWTKSLIIDTVTFRGIVNVEKIYCDFFSCEFFSSLQYISNLVSF
jgi:hypothetical protein